jgi:DNA-directed RNA polymerase subunit F
VNHAYTESTISNLITALRPYALEKPEYLMILNLRPATTAELDVVVEEMDQRFKEEEVEAMLRIIGGVLGRPSEKERDTGEVEERYLG